MPVTRLSCDRCNLYFEARTSNGVFSGREIHYNYYRAFDDDGNETIWIEYFRPGEETICARCMRDNPVYLEKYPWMKGKYN